MSSPNNTSTPSSSRQLVRSGTKPSPLYTKATSIWRLMNYPIPRGKCVHKPTLLSQTCSCLRFMLNPVQAGSSFNCDGCGHHASFHILKNEDEEEEVERFKGEEIGGNSLSWPEEDEEVEMITRSVMHEQRAGVSLNRSIMGNGGKGRNKRLIEVEVLDDDDNVGDDVNEGERRAKIQALDGSGNGYGNVTQRKRIGGVGGTNGHVKKAR